MSTKNIKGADSVQQAMTDAQISKTIKVRNFEHSGELSSAVLPVACKYSSQTSLKSVRPTNCMLAPADLGKDAGVSKTRVLIPLNPPEYDNCEIAYTIFTGTRNPAYDAKIALYNWWCLIDSAAPTNSGDDRYISMFMSIIHNNFNGKAEEAFEAFMAKRNKKLKKMEVDEGYLNAIFEDNNKMSALYNIFSNLHKNDGYGIAVVMNCMMLVFIGKQVNINTENSYYYRRYKAFAVAAQSPSAADILINLALVPDPKLCGDAYATVSGSHEFRKYIFNCMRSCISETSRLYSEPLKVVMGYLAYTEMSHIELITDFIVLKYPELLSMRCLTPLQDALHQAYQYLYSKDAFERPYCKILYDHEETACLHRNRFTSLTVAAKAVASTVNSSYRNYNTGDNPLDKAIQDAVTEYINSRSGKSSVMAVIGSTHSGFTDFERSVVVSKIIGSEIDNETYNNIRN